MTARPPLTDSELAELRARAEAATPGPWERPSFPQDHRIVARQGSAEQTIAEVRWVPPTWATRGANADYIALANPATVLRLLDELQRLRASAAAERARHERMLAQANAEWAAGDTGEGSEP